MPLSNVNIDRDKVLRLITSLDANKAHGCDGIPAAITKICDQSVVEPLVALFERCLETGLHPTQWKKLMLFLYITRVQAKECNYRSISLIPISGQKFEKLLFDVIYEPPLQK